MMRVALVLALLATSSAAAPDSSQRPVQRPAAPPSTAVAATSAETADPVNSLRPQERTRRVERAGRAAAALRAKGAVCGDPDIQGVVMGRVASSVRGCGISDAVGVQSVAGIALSPRATMDCTTAKALKAWIGGSVKPAFANTGGGVKSLRVAAHYACRTRNKKPGGRISEHGKGRAIDISEFRLRDGSIVSVLKGWGDPRTRKPMQQVHRGACGPFGTVLGPQADRYHKDHFHLDTARYRNGPYCR